MFTPDRGAMTTSTAPVTAAVARPPRLAVIAASVRGECVGRPLAELGRWADPLRTARRERPFRG